MAFSSGDKAALGDLIEKMSPDHIASILECLNEPDSLVGTAKDSAKYLFFLKLVELGMAVEEPLPEEFDPGLSATMTSFLVREEAKLELALLFDSVLSDD